MKYCYLKAVSRKDVTLNVGFKFLVPYGNTCFSQIIIYYRYGTIFREIIDTHRYSYCAIYGGLKANPLVKLILDMIKSKAPELFPECPVTGDFDLKNFTLNTDMADKATMLFNQGIYRYDFHTYLDGKSTFNLSLIVEIKSQLKESFG